MHLEGSTRINPAILGNVLLCSIQQVFDRPGSMGVLRVDDEVVKLEGALLQQAMYAPEVVNMFVGNNKRLDSISQAFRIHGSTQLSDETIELLTRIDVGVNEVGVSVQHKE